MLSGRGLCDELLTRPEESYRLWRVVVCDLESSRLRRSQEKNITKSYECTVFFSIFSIIRRVVLTEVN